MKPILFSTPMVNAILEGKKTQTRRIVKMPKEDIKDAKWGFTAFTPDNHISFRGIHSNGQYGESFVKKPWAANDILWVRETFAITSYSEKNQTLSGSYLANNTPFENIKLTDDEWDKYCKWKNEIGKKPSLFLFKSLCRLFLKVNIIRVERLQDISESDCCKEGCGSPILRDYKKPKFAALWQSINGKESWDENPFVWVIEFEKNKN